MTEQTYKLVRNDKKRRCTTCRTPILDGAQVLVGTNDKGKIKGYYCKDACSK